MRSPLIALLLLAACSGDQSLGVYNNPPEVSIISPPNGTTVDEGQVIAFEAVVDDDLDAGNKLVLRWSSTRDGEFSGPFIVEDGFARYQTANLTPGNHDISLLVTDTRGESGIDSIQVVINDLPEAPEITIERPIVGETGLEEDSFEFVASVFDSRDAPGALSLSFRSSLDGVFCEPTSDGTGVARCDATLQAGTHTLTFTAVDTEGFEDSATMIFVVQALTAVDNDGDGFSEDQGDCNDGDASVSPTAPEVYNSRDDNCNGTVDEGTQGYDDDGDGYTEVDGDCDDTDARTYPGAREVCDGEDNDCDLIIDETTVCYDDDGDGWSERDGDCDDDDGTSYPGGTEVPDGNDNDCDGVVDEGTTWYDDDGDGYAEIDGDCNDANAAISPAATEVCGDGVDNDCDSLADEANASGCITYYYDYDGDGYGTTTGQCLCTQTGYYTSRYNTDCYDSNASANPGQVSWFTNNRGDGSYDWNCDGSQTRYWTTSGTCSGWPSCSVGLGWQGSVASCGSSASYITGCGVDWFSCASSTVTRTQQCR